jgi:membrane-associated protease RseP (regulator of RpoE activity)
LLATFLTTTTLGAAWSKDQDNELTWITPQAAIDVWRDSTALGEGLKFSIPLILILLCHEMGHYLACRRYGLPATLPYFLPVPWGLGTLGAFIKIRAPIRSKRELFDVGAAGPFAGFIVLVPFLLYGVARSTPIVLQPDAMGNPQVVLGLNLLFSWVVRAFHPALPESMGLELHPFALAAWVGLLATSLNLLPLGQLDGGHILYAVLGRWQRRLAWPLWITLVALALLWPGWLLWCLIIAVIGLRHPPVTDELEPLDLPRTLLALAALAIFVVCFMPVPMRIELLAP